MSRILNTLLSVTLSRNCPTQIYFTIWRPSLPCKPHRTRFYLDFIKFPQSFIFLFIHHLVISLFHYIPIKLFLCYIVQLLPMIILFFFFLRPRLLLIFQCFVQPILLPLLSQISIFLQRPINASNFILLPLNNLRLLLYFLIINMFIFLFLKLNQFFSFLLYPFILCLNYQVCFLLKLLLLIPYPQLLSLLFFPFLQQLFQLLLVHLLLHLNLFQLFLSYFLLTLEISFKLNHVVQLPHILLLPNLLLLLPLQ